MNEQNTDKNNQSVAIEDLEARNAEEVKGGPMLIIRKSGI